jgi:hypothetical protein
MSEPQPELAGANPFSPRAVLALVLFGAVAFIALLWMIGAGMTSGTPNDGGSHAGSKGLTGYAALAQYLEHRGFAVRRSRTKGAFEEPGLLVLTPPAEADGEALEQIVSARRFVGPTLIVTPKWLAIPVQPVTGQGKPGWVTINGTRQPDWSGFHDDVSLSLHPSPAGRRAIWQSDRSQGRLPDAGPVQSGRGDRLVPLVRGGDGRVLAAYVDDGGMYPGLEDMALAGPASDADNTSLFPLVLVFEPDLIDNYGLARPENARFGERLVRAMGRDHRAMAVNFDLTLNGHALSANLLTLAFTPPFLAATLCLLMAALVAGWRAFLRFGPPARAGRAIAFGKQALVANTAGLVRRTQRLHLVTVPYAEAVRERLAAALGLPRALDPAASEAAIDRALAARQPGAQPFSAIAARLRAARRLPDILRAAQALHALERTLVR